MWMICFCHVLNPCGTRTELRLDGVLIKLVVYIHPLKTYSIPSLWRHCLPIKLMVTSTVHSITKNKCQVSFLGKRKSSALIDLSFSPKRRRIFSINQSISPRFRLATLDFIPLCLQLQCVPYTLHLECSAPYIPDNNMESYLNKACEEYYLPYHHLFTKTFIVLFAHKNLQS